VSSEPLNTLLILGAAQGLFLAVLLTTRQTNSTANRLLAVSMAGFSVYIFEGVYYAREYYRAFPHLIGVSVPLIYLFGPILYLYAQSVSRGGHGLPRRSLLHLVPFLLVTLYLLPFFLRSGAAKISYLEALFRQGSPTDLTILQQLQYPYGILYVVLTIRLLRRHRAGLTDNFSSLEAINLLWLRNLTVGVAAIWALATGLHLLDLAGFGIGQMESSLTQLAVAVLVYSVGYFGLSQPEIFHGRIGTSAGEVTRSLPLGTAGGAPPEAQTTSDAEEDRSGYEKSGLTPAEADSLMQRLREVMTERQPYLKSGLTLQELAGELGISAHNLSEVINSRSGMNFYDFVNGYRVEEVMRRLGDARFVNFTILAVAADSGFNSKATFNAFFKRHTGLTPSRFRREQGTGE